MDNEIFNEIIHKLKNERIDVDLFILHLNGEPLTDPNLFTRIQLLKNEFPSAGVYFTTNFSLADVEKIEAILTSGINQITISINSLDPNEYKELMGLDLSRTLQNVDRLLERKAVRHSNLKVRISVVVRSNCNAMAAKIKKAYENKAEIRTIQLGEWIGYPGDCNKMQDTKKECDDLFHQICFLSNGDMALCCFDAEGLIGKNIKESGILESFHSEEYEKIRDMQILRGREGFCRNCSFS